MTKPINKMSNIVQIRVGTVTFLRLQALAAHDEIFVSEECRQLLDRELSTDTAQQESCGVANSASR